MNTTHSSKQPAERFCSAHLSTIVRDLEATRVILRTVLLALAAEDGGSVSHPDNAGASRWSPAVGSALCRLSSVREVLTETPYAPAIDWPTPFTLVSALDSALWDGYCTSAPVLTSDETQIAVQVIIDSIDAVLIDCAAQNELRVIQ